MTFPLTKLESIEPTPVSKSESTQEGAGETQAPTPLRVINPAETS